MGWETNAFPKRVNVLLALMMDLEKNVSIKPHPVSQAFSIMEMEAHAFLK
jgi:hypothetical protein